MKEERIIENIYDLIKATALRDTQVDGWAELSRKHEAEARKELGNYLRYKNIELSGNDIKIGKYITVTISKNITKRRQHGTNSNIRNAGRRS